MEFSLNTLLALLAAIGTWVQIGMQVRKRAPDPPIAETEASIMPSPNTFTITKRRAYGILVAVAVMTASSLWSVFWPHTNFKYLPDDKLTVVSDQQFVNETVDMDGKKFEHCTFVNVTMHIAGKRNTALFSNQFGGPIRLHFDSMEAVSSAGSIVTLLNSANMVTNGGVGFIKGVNHHDDIIIAPVGKQ